MPGAGFLQAVHPRACEERKESELKLKLPVGSSPRLRGTQRLFDVSGVDERFIPAPAGNA